MTNIEKLRLAQELLAEVYAWASASESLEVERSLSVADSCIIEALDVLDVE